MTTARGFGTWVVQAATLERLPDSDILTALRALPKESQTLIYLADIKGLAYEEIAEITGMPAEAMASWLYQIRCRLGELAVGAAGLGSTASAYGNPSPPHQRPRRLAGWQRPGRLPSRLPYWLRDAATRHRGERPWAECEPAAAELDSAFSANRDRPSVPGLLFRLLCNHRPVMMRVLSGRPGSEAGPSLSHD
jgi:Sigma-70, region 4